MDILKTLGLKDKDKLQQDSRPSAQNSTQETKDPHHNGGCCGSCGGQKKEQEQR